MVSIFLLAFYFMFGILMGKWLKHASDMKYKKKDRPKKVDIVCPINGRRLTDQELFYGCCSACNSMIRINCSINIRKQHEQNRSV